MQGVGGMFSGCLLALGLVCGLVGAEVEFLSSELGEWQGRKDDSIMEGAAIMEGMDLALDGVKNGDSDFGEDSESQSLMPGGDDQFLAQIEAKDGAAEFEEFGRTGGRAGRAQSSVATVAKSGVGKGRMMLRGSVKNSINAEEGQMLKVEERQAAKAERQARKAGEKQLLKVGEKKPLNDQRMSRPKAQRGPLAKVQKVPSAKGQMIPPPKGFYGGEVKAYENRFGKGFKQPKAQEDSKFKHVVKIILVVSSSVALAVASVAFGFGVRIACEKRRVVDDQVFGVYANSWSQKQLDFFNANLKNARKYADKHKLSKLSSFTSARQGPNDAAKAFAPLIPDILEVVGDEAIQSGNQSVTVRELLEESSEHKEEGQALLSMLASHCLAAAKVARKSGKAGELFFKEYRIALSRRSLMAVSLCDRNPFILGVMSHPGIVEALGRKISEYLEETKP